MNYLSRQEELVLLAVFRLNNDSSLVQIRLLLNKNTAKKWSMSSVYIPLDRLHKSGLLRCETGDPTPKRGGRAKKFYFITEAGIASLKKLQEVNNIMWDGLADLV